MLAGPGNRSQTARNQKPAVGPLGPPASVLASDDLLLLAQRRVLAVGVALALVLGAAQRLALVAVDGALGRLGLLLDLARLHRLLDLLVVLAGRAVAAFALDLRILLAVGVFGHGWLLGCPTRATAARAVRFRARDIRAAFEGLV